MAIGRNVVSRHITAGVAMAESSGRTVVAALEVFRSAVSRASYFHLVVIAVGWVLTQGPHAITETLVATELAGNFHHEAFHRFFSRASWDPDEMGRLLFVRLRKLIVGTMRVVFDDTLAAKRGPEIFGIGTHLDAVRSTRKFKVFTFGHVFVTLCVLVQFPFSRSPWALPVLFRLYRQRKECERNAGEYRTKNELAAEMLKVFASWLPKHQRIEIVADNAYCNNTVTRALPANIILIGAMRPDAVLSAVPAPTGARRRGGRPAKRGAPLPKPSEVAADESRPWLRCTAHIYGRDQLVTYKTFLAQWYRACGIRLLRVVVVKCDGGSIPFRVFFAMDSSLSVPEILGLYSGRWAIEVCFRNLKQLLGFADSIARKQEAVERTAPFVGLLYSALVLWYARHAHGTTLASFPIRPWYPWKTNVCFADVLRASQRALRGCRVLDLLRNDADLTAPLRARLEAASRPPEAGA